MGPLLDVIVGKARHAAASGDLPTIERVAQQVDTALSRLPPESPARTHMTRVAAEIALVRHGLEPACAELARRAESLTGLQAGEPAERWLCELTLARLRGELGLCGDDRGLHVGLGTLRALSTDDAVDGSVRREAALSWGDLAWRAGVVRESASAYELALDLRIEAVDKLVLRSAREDELRLASEAAPRAALAHARDGDAWRAAEAIERGRALLMRPRDFTGGQEDPSVVRGFIERAAANASLVYLVPLHETGLAIIVRGNAATTLELPGLTTDGVADQVRHVIDAQHNRIKPASEASLADIGAWSWDAAMGPVLTAVRCGELVLIACGLTSALPLHAAWRAGSGQRRYVLEDVVIRYAPNARTVTDERTSEEAIYRSVLAIGNPDNTLPPLRYAEAEIRAIPASLNADTLVERRASRPEVLQRWDRVDIIHFACHGRASVEDPLSSGVILAGGEVLTAQHVIDRRLDAHPLVILSACETAVIGARLPDEVVSLQSAFLAAGARGVVATLWPVDDELSARLIGRFYTELVDRGLSPAAALTESQRWLAVAAQPDGPRRVWPVYTPRTPVPGPPPTWAAVTYSGR